MSGNLKLKVMHLNAENLFLLSDVQLEPTHLQLDENRWQRFSTSVFGNKPLSKIKKLAAIVEELDPDIVLLEEIGGSESLANFNRLFLQSRFSPALIEGNSSRNIDVGFLIKKDLPFYFDLVSNRSKLLNFNYAHEIGSDVPSHKFSRDVAELHLFKNDREKPFFIFLLTHLKSRLDPEGIDPNGLNRRQAELNSLIQIYLDLEKKFHGKVPMVIAGDFNGNASLHNTDPEFRAIYTSTPWQDICELAKIALEKRFTFYQVSRNHHGEGRQIDYVFLPPLTQGLLQANSVSVYRYKGADGLALEPPVTLEAKAELPSDHYPLAFTLENIPLID